MSGTGVTLEYAWVGLAEAAALRREKGLTAVRSEWSRQQRNHVQAISVWLCSRRKVMDRKAMHLLGTRTGRLGGPRSLGHAGPRVWERGSREKGWPLAVSSRPRRRRRGGRKPGSKLCGPITLPPTQPWEHLTLESRSPVGPFDLPSPV